MAQYKYHIISSLNGDFNSTSLVGFSKLRSEPGAIYRLIDANTDEIPEGLKFYQEQNLLIVEHNGKRILALKGFFAHKENPAKFVVDKAADGTVENIITTNSTVIDEDGRAYIIASESLLVANSELNTTNSVAPVDTTAEPEPDFFTDNWVWFAVGGAIILAGVAAGSSSSSSKGPSTDAPKPDKPDAGMPTLESIKATGNTITLTYNEALDGNNLPEASAFTVQVIGGANNPVTVVAISDSGDVIILVAYPIAQGSNFTIAYTDPTTGDDTNAIQDEQGNDASTFNGKTGLVVDGYIQGAQLYADYNNNGIAEDDEILEGIITDEFGRFFLTTTDINAPLIAVGGTNIDTGIENTLTMRAPEGATVINPITTVVQQYLNDNEGTSLEQAETAVKEILGITLPANESLSDYEPISSKNQEMQEIAAQIVEVAMQAETTKAGDGSTVFENIAAAKAPLDLTTTDDVTAITKGTGITAETVQALVTQTTNIKDTDTIADITTQQKSLIVALKDDTGLEDDDLNSSVGTIEVTSKFADGVTQYSVDGGKIWTADFNAQEGVNTVQIRQVDAEGNPLGEVTNFAFTLNTKAPTVRITYDAEDAVRGDVNYTFSFSEEVKGFEIGDIEIVGGEVNGELTSTDDMNFVLVVTPDVDSTQVTVDVAANVATDVAGNDNVVAKQSLQRFDTLEVGVFGITLSEDTGRSKADFVTKTAAQTISAKLIQSLVPSDKLYGSVNDGKDWLEITDKVSGRVITWDGAMLALGENIIAFRIGEFGVKTGLEAYVLDTEVPTQTVDKVAISDDSGSSNSDFITNQISQTITAKLSAILVASRDILFGSVDGGETWIDITKKVAGTAISWDIDLIDGENSVVFKVTDLASNEGTNTGLQVYVLDTTAPTQTVGSVDISLDTGIGIGDSIDFITNAELQTITAKLSSGLTKGEILFGSVNGGANWTDITDKVTGIEISWDGAKLIEGKNSIVFKVRNLAGNDSAETGSQEYVLDTKVPTQTVSDVELSDDSGSSNSDFVTNQASQTITARLSAELASDEQLYVSVNGEKTWIDITDKVAGTAIRWDKVTLLEGTYTVTFGILNTAGSYARVSVTDYTLDTTVPIQTVYSIAISDDTGSGASDFVTKIASQTITAKLSSELATDKELLYGSVNGGKTWTDITDKVTASTEISWDGVMLMEGENSIVFQVRAFVGNVGTNTGLQSYTLDTKVPTQIVGDITLSDDTGSSDSDLITKTASQTITAELSSVLVTGDILFGSVDGGTTWTDITGKVIAGTVISWDGVTLNGGIDGKNSIIFKIKDLADNVGVNTGLQNYELDTAIPIQTVDDVKFSGDTGSSGSVFTTVKQSQTITAELSSVLAKGYILSGSVDGGKTWTDITDRATGTMISWEINLINGENSIVFKIIDLADNIKETDGTSYILEITVPEQTVDNVALSDDTGSSANDLVTKTTSQTITATLSAALVTGDMLFGSVDGGMIWEDITNQASGTAIRWNIDLIEGKYSIVFRIRNQDGYYGKSTGLQDYELDTTVPTQIIDDVVLSDDTGSDTSDFITNIASQTITARLSSTLATGELLYGSVNGGADWTNITDKVQETVIIWTKSLSGEGENSIVFKVTDLAGNKEAISTPTYYTLDTTAPTQTVGSVDISLDTGLGIGDSIDFITNAEFQTITAKLSAGFEKGEILSGSVNGGANWTDITDKVTGTEISWDGAKLVEGKNSIVFKVTDLAGNDSAETGSQEYVLDTKVPTQTVSNVELSDDSGSSNSDFVTNQASQTITARLSAELVSDERLYVSVNGEKTWIDITDKVAGTAIRWDKATLLEGTYTVTFVIINTAGSYAKASVIDYTLDTTVPIQTVYSITISDDTGSGASDFVTKIASQTITAKLSSELATDKELLYGSVNGGKTWTDITDKVTAGTEISWDGVMLMEGENSIVFQVRAFVGNVGTNTGLQVYILDTQAPTQTVDNVTLSDDTGSDTKDFITKTTFQTITAALSAVLVTGDILSGSVDGGAAWTDITDKVTGTAISWDGAKLVDGKNLIVFKVADLAGNEGATTGLQNYLLDTKVPTQTVSDVELSDDSGSSNSDFITKTTSQTVTATLSAALATGDRLSGSVDGGAAWTDITGKVIGTEISWDISLIEGKHSIVFRISNQYGHFGKNTGLRGYELDTTIPTQTVDNVTLSDDTGSDTKDFITKTTFQTITAALSVALVTGDILYGSVDGEEAWTDITDKVIGTAISWDGAKLVEGKNLIVFKVTDLAGNEGATTGLQNYVLDTKVPTQTVSDVELSDDSGSSNSDFVTNQASQTITATLSGALVTGDILSGSVNGGANWTDITDKVTAGTAISWDGVTLNEGIDGKNVIVFRITNIAGNFKDISGINYVLDTVAPTQTVDNVTLSNDTGSDTNDLITKITSQAITAKLSARLMTGDILFGSVDGGTTWTDITDKVDDTAIIWDGVTLNKGLDGKNSIVFKVTDLAGNGGENTGLQDYELDTTKPTAAIGGEVTAEAEPVFITLGEDATIQSSEVGTGYLVHKNVIVTKLADIVGAGASKYSQATITSKDTDTHISTEGLVGGAYNTYTADAAGNLSEAKSGIIVQDTSKVVFDVVNQTSSSHSGRIITDAVTDIYIILNQSDSGEYTTRDIDVDTLWSVLPKDSKGEGGSGTQQIHFVSSTPGNVLVTKNGKNATKYVGDSKGIYLRVEDKNPESYALWIGNGGQFNIWFTKTKKSEGGEIETIMWNGVKIDLLWNGHLSLVVADEYNPWLVVNVSSQGLA